jgi:hypothetical protein
MRTFEWNAADFFVVSNKTLISQKQIGALTTFPILGNYNQLDKSFVGLKQLSPYTFYPNLFNNVDIADGSCIFPGLCEITRIQNANASDANAVIEPYYFSQGVSKQLKLSFPLLSFPSQILCVVTITKEIKKDGVLIKALRNDLFGQWANDTVPLSKISNALQLPLVKSITDTVQDLRPHVILPDTYDEWFELQHNLQTDEVNVIAAKDITGPCIIPCMGNFTQNAKQVNPYTHVSGVTNQVANKLWPAGSDFLEKTPPSKSESLKPDDDDVPMDIGNTTHTPDDEIMVIVTPKTNKEKTVPMPIPSQPQTVGSAQAQDMYDDLAEAVVAPQPKFKSKGTFDYVPELEYDAVLNLFS